MSLEVLDNGAERFVTEGGVTITRERHETPYEGAIDGYIDGLDSRRGAVFSSNYEYPGRYTRWDTAIIDPPLVISARGRVMRIEALNRRGRALLADGEEGGFQPDLGQGVQARRDVLRLEIAEPGRVFTEEERSRAPSVFTVLRAITRCSRSPRMPISGSTAPSATTSPSSSTRSTYQLEREENQRDLVLYLPDEILVVDHYSAKAWTDRYDFAMGDAGHCRPAARAERRAVQAVGPHPAARRP